MKMVVVIMMTMVMMTTMMVVMNDDDDDDGHDDVDGDDHDSTPLHIQDPPCIYKTPPPKFKRAQCLMEAGMFVHFSLFFLQL